MTATMRPMCNIISHSIHTQFATRPFYRFLSSFSSSSSPSATKNKRRLDVAIVGAPNSGKSQLLNVLTGSPVAAVSRKRHTTRDGIMGALTKGDTQFLFVDTPGFLRHVSAQQENLRELMASTAGELQAVDYTLIVVDAARKVLTEELKETLVSLMILAMRSGGRQEYSIVDYRNQEQGKTNPVGSGHDEAIDMETTPPEGKPLSLARQEKFAIVLNKVDLVRPKTSLLELAEQIANLAEETILYRGEPDDKDRPPSMTDEELDDLYPAFFYTSALKNEGVDDVLEHLLNKATPCDSWILPPDATTLMSPPERVEEVIREKLYRCLHREVPHHVMQKNRIFQKVGEVDATNKNEISLPLLIQQDLLVRTKSHQKLVRGSSGKTIQRIQETAQRDLERVFGTRVFLKLHVKLLKSKQSPTLE